MYTSVVWSSNVEGCTQPGARTLLSVLLIRVTLSHMLFYFSFSITLVGFIGDRTVICPLLHQSHLDTRSSAVLSYTVLLTSFILKQNNVLTLLQDTQLTLAGPANESGKPKKSCHLNAHFVSSVKR
jgi:hypothetical protein